MKVDNIFEKRYKQLNQAKHTQQPIIYDMKDFDIKIASRLPKWKLEEEKSRIIENLKNKNLNELNYHKFLLNTYFKLKVKKFIDS